MTVRTGSGPTVFADLVPGFAEPVLDAQATFRGLLTAMARPGTVVELRSLPPAPPPLTRAAAAVCLTLLDLETPVWLDDGAPGVAGWLRFHCGCPLTAAATAARFALITAVARSAGLAGFPIGSAEAPEQAATLIIQVPSFNGTVRQRLSGPGIQDTIAFGPDGVPAWFWDALRTNHARFPQGFDVIFAANDQIAALPRTTRIDA